MQMKPDQQILVNDMIRVKVGSGASDLNASTSIRIFDSTFGNSRKSLNMQSKLIRIQNRTININIVSWTGQAVCLAKEKAAPCLPM